MLGDKRTVVFIPGLNLVLLTVALLTLSWFHVTDAAHAVESEASSPLIVDVENSDTEPEQLSPQELHSLVAPIALYPDALLGEILTASTQSVQVILAARYLKEHQGKIEEDAGTEWDISVRTLLHYPAVLNMMDQNLSWTDRLGEAVINQQKDVMAAIQEVRTQAYNAGNLTSNDKQTVVVEENTITIASASPRMIYVPVYDPYAVLLPSPAPVISFGVGYAVGGWFSYSFSWPHGHIYVHSRPWHAHHHYRYHRYPRHHRYAWRSHKHRYKHRSVHRSGHRSSYRSTKRSVHHPVIRSGNQLHARRQTRPPRRFHNSARRGQTTRISRTRTTNAATRGQTTRISGPRAAYSRRHNGGRSPALNRSAMAPNRSFNGGYRRSQSARAFGHGGSYSRGGSFSRGGIRGR